MGFLIMKQRKPNEKVKIYGLSDPRTKECRYIGITRYTLERRLKQHLVELEKQTSGNPPPFKGKKRTEEVIRKMAITRKKNIEMKQKMEVNFNA